MKFRDLNTTPQEKICYSIHGKEMWELSNIGRIISTTLQQKKCLMPGCSTKVLLGILIIF